MNFDGFDHITKLSDFNQSYWRTTVVILLQAIILITFEKKGFKNDLVKIKDSDPYSKSH
jgi:hypothetical protein